MNYKKIIYQGLLVAVFTAISAKADTDKFDRAKHLKDYAGDTLIASQVGDTHADGILSGEYAERNAETVMRDYNCIQPNIYPAWNGFWPERKPADLSQISFRTDRLDNLVNWGVANDRKVIHHCLIFPNKYYPKWFCSADYSGDELEHVMNSFIRSVITANDNGRKVYAFNLINEIFDNEGGYREYGTGEWGCKWVRMGDEDDRSGLSGSAKINARHPVFIRKVFETAAALTDAKLEIRDYNVAFGGQKADGLYQLVAHLKKAGVRLDAVGFQAHLDVGGKYDYAAFKANVKRFRDSGVDVYITELDVGVRNVKNIPNMGENDWREFLKEQSEIYYGFVKASREAGVKMISTWGYRDGSMGGWRKDQRAWILNEDYSRKEAYYSYLKALYETF